MIYVTQGHEKGIGLEIFFRSLHLFTQAEQEKFTLIINKNEISNYQNLIRKSAVNIVSFTTNTISQSAQSLLLGLDKATAGDILVTLPTSKNQLLINGVQHFGYTDFFRHHYKAQIPMCFKYKKTYYSILTDHIPLKEVSKNISIESAQEKINILSRGIEKKYGTLANIFLVGLNPHCGESGLFGIEENSIHFKLKGIDKVIPADSHHNYLDLNKDQLFIFNYHDQGLVAFKQYHGFIGINITFGLPFIRLSVDHGTNFGQYNKNISNISGMLYVMNEALRLGDNCE